MTRARAFVLINIAAGAAQSVLAALGNMSFVTEVNAVSGPYDMIAVVDAENYNDIGRYVLERIQAVPGIQKTLTCNVFFPEK